MKMAVVVVVVVKMMIQNIRVRDRQGGCATAAEPLEGSDDDHHRHRAGRADFGKDITAHCTRIRQRQVLGHNGRVLDINQTDRSRCLLDV